MLLSPFNQPGTLHEPTWHADSIVSITHPRCLQVHGLFGSRANWKVIAEELRDAMREEEGILFYISEVNEFKKVRLGGGLGVWK